MSYITEIIIALLALIGTIIGSFSGFRLTAYRVEQLEKKVEMHNNFAAKIPLIEARVERLEKKKEE